MSTYTETLSNPNTDASSVSNSNLCLSNISLNHAYPTNAAWYKKFFIPKTGILNKHVCLICKTELSGTKNN